MRGLRPAVLAACAAGLYARFGRGPVLTWGSTREEAAGALPGDELLAAPDGQSTRAVWIDAPAEAVWPWLAQMGPSPRGGAYTYDWIENLMGLDMHSVDVVLEEFQHPQPGDEISFGSNTMRLQLCERPRSIAWRSEDGGWVWLFALREQGGRTRLISRNRFRLPGAGARLGMLLIEPGSLVMERRMLLGIRERAERLAASR